MRQDHLDANHFHLNHPTHVKTQAAIHQVDNAHTPIFQMELNAIAPTSAFRTPHVRMEIAPEETQHTVLNHPIHAKVRPAIRLSGVLLKIFQMEHLAMIPMLVL